MDLLPEPLSAPSLTPRACETCRRKKKRCDGGKPHCSRCIHTGTSCTYPRFPLKHGPKPGKDIARHSGFTLGFRGHNTCVSHKRNSISRGDTLSTDPSISEPSSSLVSSGPNDERSDSGDVGEPAGRFCLNQRTNTELWSGDDLIPTSLLPPHQILSHLVKIFFDLIHPQIRVLHRPSFLSWIENSDSKSDPHSIFLILTVSALAARFSERPEVELFDRMLREGSESPHNYQSHAGGTYSKRCQRGKGFLTKASQLFQRETSQMERLELKNGTPQKPSIRFMQATTLLAFSQIATALSSRAHALISTAVRLAYDLGLDEIDGDRAYQGLEPNDNRPENVKMEELRRVWWAISDMENFVCVVKCRPRLIDWNRCKTRLPCDDTDWFESRQGPQYFLPSGVHQLRNSLDLPGHISLTGKRILFMHLFANLAYIAADRDYVDGWHDSISCIEECVAAWKPNIAQTVLESSQTPGSAEDYSSDALVAYLVLQTAEIVICNMRMFKDATPAVLFGYYEKLSQERSVTGIPLANHLRESSAGYRAFSKALHTSDMVCLTIRDQPTDSMAPFFFVAPLLLAPACIQLLAKSSTTAWPELMERASLSLRILTMRIEHCADFWELGHSYLVSISQLEKKLTVDSRCEGTHMVRHQHFPDSLNAAFLAELSSICFSGSVSRSCLRDGDDENGQLQESNNVELHQMLPGPLPVCSDTFLEHMEKFDGMEIDWEAINAQIAIGSEFTGP